MAQIKGKNNRWGTRQEKVMAIARKKSKNEGKKPYDK